MRETRFTCWFQGEPGLYVASVNKHRGRWRAVYRGADGKWREKAIPPGTPAKERRAFAHELEAREKRIAEGLEVPPSAETLASASARYLKAVRNARGYRGVESFWRCRILPVLGGVPVGQLKPTQVDELLVRPMGRETTSAALKTALVAAGLVTGWETVCCAGTRGKHAPKEKCGYVGQGRPETGGKCPRCGGLNLIARGIPIDFSPKGFRSSGITRIVEATGSIAAAAEQAGHARTSTTEAHYVKVSKAYVADAVAKAFAPPAPPSPPPPPPPVFRLSPRAEANRRWRMEASVAEMKR